MTRPEIIFNTIRGEKRSLTNLYAGASAFLIGGGPSISAHDCTQFQKRGVLTMAINNIAANNIRPNLWVCGDAPRKFGINIWKDPTIIKFIRNTHLRGKLVDRNESGSLFITDYLAGEMPGVLGYPISERIQINNWLHEKTVTWGNLNSQPGDDGIAGVRSSMMVAVKILYVLGFKYVYLLGCDFKMTEEKPYAFPQQKDARGVKANTRLFSTLNTRFNLLQPKFVQAGFFVYNCTEGSKLDAFPKKKLEVALEECCANIPQKVDTYGMYNFQTEHMIREIKKGEQVAQPNKKRKVFTRVGKK